jgi:NitT/TauT family transport system ATP-binding protein
MMSTLHGIVPEIACARIGKQYRQGAEVLRDINFTVYKGEILSILGPSGCGKSTLLKMIAGLTSVTSGEILINGMTPANARELVSFIFQDATLLPWRTVKRNVDLGLELEGATSERRDAKTADMLKLVGLSDVAGAYPRELSGGMKMRVSIARALATRPRILLMDEPFAALDEMTRDHMNDELLRLQKQHGWTIVFVTHSVAEAVILSSRILVLAPNPGRVLEMVNVDLDRDDLAEVRSGDAFEQEVSRVSRILRGAHLV